MEKAARDRLIQQYKEGYRAVADALAGATGEELAARPAPNKWSARDVVHHLADSEMMAAMRLRLLVAEDQPTIKGYDQDLFAKTLYYDRPVEPSLQAFKFARESTAQLLDRLTEAQWKRTGTHTESGAYGVEKWLQTYAVHAHNHAEQIRRARASAKPGSTRAD
jgi:DinB family protein